MPAIVGWQMGIVRAHADVSRRDHLEYVFSVSIGVSGLEKAVCPREKWRSKCHMSPKNRILGLERRILGAKQISFEYIANIRLAQTENRKKTHFLVRREIRGAVHLAMQCFKKTTTPLDSHSLGV
ncbi:MAG TPA: hypothetical protein PLO68_18620, partial [Sedimentisphaerales bacterium]|nr:hypothetical protein [Sedimentisphaerales bacterium]